MLTRAARGDTAVVEDLGGSIVEAAKLRLSMKHGMARLEHVWGAGAEELPVEELKEQIDTLLLEYFGSSDVSEVQRTLREMNVAHFHHEFVKRALTRAIEHGEREQGLVADLIKALVGEGAVTELQAQRGFERTRAILGDLKLDAPAAPAAFAKVVERCASFLGDFSAEAPAETAEA